MSWISSSPDFIDIPLRYFAAPIAPCHRATFPSVGPFRIAQLAAELRARLPGGYPDDALQRVRIHVHHALSKELAYLPEQASAPFSARSASAIVGLVVIGVSSVKVAGLATQPSRESR